MFGQKTGTRSSRNSSYLLHFIMFTFDIAISCSNNCSFHDDNSPSFINYSHELPLSSKFSHSHRKNSNVCIFRISRHPPEMGASSLWWSPFQIIFSLSLYARDYREFPILRIQPKRKSNLKQVVPVGKGHYSSSFLMFRRSWSNIQFLLTYFTPHPHRGTSAEML